MKYGGNFLVRTPPEMVLWEVRQLWLFCLHCCFESMISVEEKSKLQANITETGCQILIHLDLYKKKRKRKSFLSSTGR